MRRTQGERRQESETRLIAAAVKLISEKGANGFTLAEVGHEAGYSRSLPGHYFDTKEQLLAKVVEHITDESLANITNRYAERGLASIEEHWLQSLREKSVETHRTRALYALFLEAMFDPELAKIMARYNRRAVDLIAQDLQLEIEKGVMRKDVDVMLEAQALLAFRRGATLVRFNDPDFDLLKMLGDYLVSVRERLKA
ncbi:MAG: TetR/AcrR family transcriptional regulator [Blastomonas sp.]